MNEDEYLSDLERAELHLRSLLKEMISIEKLMKLLKTFLTMLELKILSAKAEGYETSEIEEKLREMQKLYDELDDSESGVWRDIKKFEQ